MIGEEDGQTMMPEPVPMRKAEISRKTWGERYSSRENHRVTAQSHRAASGSCQETSKVEVTRRREEVEGSGQGRESSPNFPLKFPKP
jgi:hypothetical protein